MSPTRVPGLVTITLLASMLAGMGEAVASHTVCPVEVSFPFLDFDGNLCHDAGDSGDVSASLLTAGVPYAPPAGNLVCPEGAKLVAKGSNGSNYVWSIPGHVVLDCDVIVDDTLVVTAGADLSINAKVKGPWDLIFDVPNGDLVVGARRKLSSKRGGVSLTSGNDITIGERASAKAGDGSVSLTAGGTVSLSDRVKFVSKGDFNKAVRLDGHDVTAGDGIKLVQRGSFDGNGVFIDAHPTTGAVSIQRVKMKARHEIGIAGATVTLGPGSVVQNGKDRTGRITAETQILLDAVKVSVGNETFRLTVNTAGSITATNSKFRSVGIPDVVFTTAAGGTCDITGTVFVGAAPEFVNCTTTGP